MKPLPPNHENISLENIGGDETLTKAYEYIAPKFEEKLLNMVKTMETQKQKKTSESLMSGTNLGGISGCKQSDKKVWRNSEKSLQY